MPSILISTVCAALVSIPVVFCLIRLIQNWSWGKVIMTVVCILSALLFGEYVTIEKIVNMIPALWDFAQEFGLRILIIAILILFAVQVASLIGKFFESSVWRMLVNGIRITMNFIANIHPWIAKCVVGIMWLTNCTQIALASFYEIDNDDDVEDSTVKVRELHAMSLLYDIIDYWAAGLCALLVSYMVEYHWSFAEKTVGVWLFDIVFALSALYGCFKSGKDLTWGEAHRRAHDGVYEHNHVAGWIYRIVQHVVGVVWDGPEQIVIFYKNELRTKSSMIIIAIVLSAVQGAFWTWLYTVGHNTFIERIMTWF